MKRKHLLLTLFLVFTMFFGAIGCEREQAKKEAQLIIDEAKKEAQLIIDQANEEADKTIQDAEKQAWSVVDEAKKEASIIVNDARIRAQSVTDQAKEEVERIFQESISQAFKSKKISVSQYPGNNQWIQVDRMYLTRFKRVGNKLEYTVRNNNQYGDVKPNFKIKFYDNLGITTGVANVIWLISRISPGQTRSDDTIITGVLSNNPTKYYEIIFD